MMRSYATVELHDYYGLKIPDDNLEEFRGYISSLGVEQSGEITMYGNMPETNHILDLEEASVSVFSDEFDLLSVKIRNVSDAEIRDMGIKANLLDANGDILQNIILFNSGVLSSGQGATVSVSYRKTDVETIEFTSMSYTKEDGIYTNNTLDGFGTISAHPTEQNAEEQETTQQQEAQPAPNQPETASSPAGQSSSGSEKDAIEKAIRSRIADKYTGVEIGRITINPDYGTENILDDCIVLVYLTWNVTNSPETSEEVLKMYSDDMAVLLADQFTSAQEFSVFWKVPHLTENTSKWSYERRDGKMYQTDNMLGWNW